MTEQRLHVGFTILRMPDISIADYYLLVFSSSPTLLSQQTLLLLHPHSLSTAISNTFNTQQHHHITSTATMQFTAIFATAFALVASATAATPSYPINNGTTPAVGTAAASGTGAPPSSTSGATFVPGENSASTLSTGALGLLVVGGIAMVSFHLPS